MGIETKFAEGIEPGDVVYVRGRELHDDLAGLMVEIAVERVEKTDDGWVEVYEPGRDDGIWWRTDEPIRFFRHHPDSNA